LRESAKVLSILLAGLFFFFLEGARAQQSSDEANKLRLAQSFERSGMYEKAASLYEELYDRNPSNFVFFDGLHRMYVQLKEYPKAISLVQTKLEHQPSDLTLLGTLSEDYLKAGKEPEARATWEQALATDEKNPSVYRYVSNILFRNRLFRDEVDVLLRGRKNTDKPNLFAMDLGFAYTILGQYGDATMEYAREVQTNPTSLNFVESRMAMYTAKPDGLASAIATVQKEIQDNQKNVTLYRLLAWLYLEGKQFEGALAVYRVIDQLGSSSGRELLSFADRAFKEKAYEVAAEAFKEVIQRYPREPLVPVARLGFARVIEEISAKRDSLGSSVETVDHGPEEQSPVNETSPTYGGAIASYNAIVRDYLGSEYALQALYRIGLIKFDRFFDIDGALQTFDQIDNQFPTSRMAPAVALKAGEILIAKGELGMASERFKKVGVIPFSTQSEKDKATYELAELDYFQGSYDSALVKLKGLLVDLSADIANDALLLQEFIRDHRTRDGHALEDYAHAGLLERQRRFSEAIAVLQNLIDTDAASPLVDDAMLKLGRLERELGAPMRALSIYQKLIFDHPESILRDEAQLGIGEIYQFSLNDKQKAIAAYQELLEKYPTSLYLDEVRKRIRQLRGDAL
jgi:tetratricopeptide (TPR) repeat protein